MIKMVVMSKKKKKNYKKYLLPSRLFTGQLFKLKLLIKLTFGHLAQLGWLLLSLIFEEYECFEII